MNEQWDCLKTAREELMPRLETLGKMAEGLGGEDRASFFTSIAEGIRVAEEPADLMDPFLTLSTSAFRGFHMTMAETLLLDEVLERASAMSEVLARGDEPTH